MTSQHGSDSAALWRLDSLVRCVDDVLTCARESNPDGYDRVGEWMSRLVSGLEGYLNRRPVARGTGPFQLINRPWHLLSLLACLGGKYYYPFEYDG